MFRNSAICATVDLVTASEHIPFIPRVDINLLQPRMNKEVRKNRASFFHHDVFRFENEMMVVIFLSMLP
jgi:hypothetical protein